MALGVTWSGFHLATSLFWCVSLKVVYVYVYPLLAKPLFKYILLFRVDHPTSRIYFSPKTFGSSSHISSCWCRRLKNTKYGILEKSGHTSCCWCVRLKAVHMYAGLFIFTLSLKHHTNYNPLFWVHNLHKGWFLATTDFFIPIGFQDPKLGKSYSVYSTNI